MAMLLLPLSLLLLSTSSGPADDPPIVIVDRDNVRIDRSCTVEIRADLVEDSDGNGVIHIVADDITVTFSDAFRELIQVAEGTPWDTIGGIGVRIDGRSDVTLRNAHAHRFKVGIYASDADGLTLEDCDVAGGYAQRLGSTPQQEDAADWLSPHHNDDNQWMHRYGAGIYIEDSDNVTVRSTFARKRQNGIVLDNVTNSRIYDNDCSFLSGWGLAMWRSSGNIVSHNAFDFCIRGYSHGVYNRGQDSAGILMFEKCNDNIIAHNSATHSGDGVFAFAGLDAVGERWVEQERQRLREETGEREVDHLIVYPKELIEHCRSRGNNRNLFINNDLSYAAAHGLELTFSFDNAIISNRFVGNAICGVWGGYSQRNLIADNHFEDNGEGAYGLERGGVNIEHGRANRILDNRFLNNRCGVHLWWDQDHHLFPMPWSKANDPRFEEGPVARDAEVEPRMLPSIDNWIAGNTFDGDDVGVHLRNSDRLYFLDNQFASVEAEIDQEHSLLITEVLHVPGWETPEHRVLGERGVIGARSDLAGREKIIMTQWGPYDWREPLLHRTLAEAAVHEYRLRGDAAIASIDHEGDITVSREGGLLRIAPKGDSSYVSYRLTVTMETGEVLETNGEFLPLRWTVRAFNYETDPRADIDAWRNEVERDGVTFETDSLTFPFGGGGPSNIESLPSNVRDAELGADRFGIIATTSIELPAGRWRISTSSDDGIRVAVNEELLIDDWTHHATRRIAAEFGLSEAQPVSIVVEYFELEGGADLWVELEPVLQ